VAKGHDQAKAHDNNSGIDSYQHSTVSFILLEKKYLISITPHSYPTWKILVGNVRAKGLFESTNFSSCKNLTGGRRK